MGTKSCSCLSPYRSWSIYISVGRFRQFVLCCINYLIVIELMSRQGWALALNPKMEYRSFLGWAVSLFLFSDALIAVDKFYFSFSFSGVLILATYWIAIFLIARSASK